MEKEILKKQEQLRQLTLNIGKYKDIKDGKDGVAGRALNDEERKQRDLDMAEIIDLQEEIKDLEVEAEIKKAERSAKARSAKITTVDQKYAESFSMARAAQMAIMRHKGEHVGDEFKIEKDMDKEANDLARQSGIELGKGAGIPEFVSETKKRLYLETQGRAWTAGTAATAGNLSNDSTDFSQYSWLSNKPVIEQAGARIITGVVGTFDLPAGDTNSTYAYATETGTVADSGATTKTKNVGPKRGGMKESVTMMLMNQYGGLLDSLLMPNFMIAEQNTLEAVALKGGSSNQPTGLQATAGVPVVAIGTNGGAITVAKWDEAVAALKANNAGPGPFVAIVRPEIAHSMSNILRDAGSGRFLLDDEKMIAKWGIKVLESNNVITNGVKGSSSDCMPVTIGDWRNLVIFKWAFSQFTVDNITSAAAGSVNLIYNSFNNVYWTHDKCFVNILDVRNV